MTEARRDGILNINKPTGMTSFSVVARIRRVTGIRKVGHGGTLDPFAQGVLPVLLGRATGAARYMESYRKSYRVTVRFGVRTDTQDLTGQPMGGRMPDASEWEAYARQDGQGFRDILAAMVGSQKQTPPMYSAVKIQGKKLYQYARQGLDVARPERDIEVYDARLVSVSPDSEQPEIQVEFDCSKGTYIRTLCEDIGEKTGWGAHASALIRTVCGPYELTQSADLDAIMALFEGGADEGMRALQTEGHLLPVESAMVTLPELSLDRQDALGFIQGQYIAAESLAATPPFQAGNRVRVNGPKGFVGVGIFQSTEEWLAQPLRLRAERVFTEREDYLE